MTGTGYPDLFDDLAAELVDGFRCVDENGGRRCQLFTGHDVPHAAAWAEDRPTPPGAPRRVGPTHWTRWDGTRVWEQGPGSERIRWCCLYRV